ncbi:MAG: endonuclease III domain-containing protein [Methanomassiliicoccales archaeon]
MDLEELYARLRQEYRVEGWWPAHSAFEVMVGAILTQQTAWENVAAVLDELRARGALDPWEIARMDRLELQGLIRPTGFYRQKASRLQGLASHLVDNYDSAEELLSKRDAREELLSIRGIGKETADSILLFGGNRPVFVAAAYTARILSRTGVLPSDDYDEIQGFVEERLPMDPEVLGGLYAAMVQLGKEHCRSRPRCGGCPLSDSCPSAEHQEERIAHHGRHQE